MSSYLDEKFDVIPICGTGGQNAIKHFILEYLSLKFSCDQKIKTTGLILRRNIFVFSFLLLISKYVQKGE